MKILNDSAFKAEPEAILIDLDNTLYEYEPAHRSGTEAVETKVTSLFSIEKTKFQLALQQARDSVKQRLKNQAASHSRLLYFQNAFELLGLGSNPLHALDLEQTYWRTYLNSVQLFEGVREFLDDLRLSDIPAVLVSDLTTQIQLRKLVFFEIDHLFDFVVTSEEAGIEKPDSKPFQLALEKLGLTAAQVWMIGDDAKKDIIGAKALGMTSLQKIHAGVEPGSGDCQPDGCFSHFPDISQLLRSLQDHAKGANTVETRAHITQ